MTEAIRNGDRDVLRLVERVKSGDKEAFMSLTRLYQRNVYMLAYAFFRNRDDALDIVQETFLRLYQKIDKYRPDQNFKNWLLQMAKNLCIDLYRKHHRKISDHNADADISRLASTSTGDGDGHDAHDLRQIFASCLKNLSERQRLVFIMKHFNQLEYGEIAEILDVALGTVKSLHHKAVRNLRILAGPSLGREA